MSIEAMKLVRDAIEQGIDLKLIGAKHILNQAIEQAQKQEPVAKVVSTAPKQIWLDIGFDPSDEDEISFNDLCNATWSDDNATGYGIEYVRSDLASPPQCRHEQESVQIAGFDVVIDESMPPNKFKFEQAQKQEPMTGWTGNTKADAALVMLDRLDVSPADDDRVDEISKIVRELASPPQRKPLTDEQIIDLWPSLIMHQHTYAFARAIEAAHGIMSLQDGKGEA